MSTYEWLGNGHARDPEPAVRDTFPAGRNRPRHDIPRHAEDPPGAYERAAEEVCDPERIRVNAVALGKASQAIEPRDFLPLLDQVCGGVADVRSGAITGPAHSTAKAPLELRDTTPVDVERVRADHEADGVKADRLEATHLPRAEKNAAEAQAAVMQARAALEAAEERMRNLKRDSQEESTRPGEVMQRVALSPKAAFGVAVVDGAVTTVVLEPAVSELIVTTVPYGSILISAGISVSLMIGSAAAGLGLAAMRLRGRLVGALLLVAFLAVMAKLVTGLDLLREGEPGGTQTLTAASLMASFVAVLTGYSIAVFRDAQVERRLSAEPGTPLADAVEERDEAAETLAAAELRHEEARADVESLSMTLEALRDSAARAEVAALARKHEGIAAEVEIETIWRVAETHIAQEVAANRAWAVAMARLAYEKTRAEQLLEDDEPEGADATADVPAGEPADSGLDWQKLAIATLAGGAVGGAAVDPLALAVGGTAAALMLLLGGRRRRPPRRGSDDSAVPRQRPIEPAATDDNPDYLRQPDHMVNKYGDGGSDGSQRQ